MVRQVVLKVDNRFRTGHIRKEWRQLRGNAKTLAITRIDVTGAPIHYQLCPPLVVSSEMADALKKAGLLKP